MEISMKKTNKKVLGFIPKLVVMPLVVFAMGQSALATSAIGNSFGYEVVGDIDNNNLYCDIGTGVEITPASISDLDKLASIKGKVYGFQADLVTFASLNGLVVASFDIDGNSKAYTAVRKSNPDMTVTGVMKTTSIKSCHIIDVPFLKKATIFQGKSAVENNKTINFSYASTTDKTENFSTESTRGSETTIEVGAQVGFEFKGISGGSSVNHSSTQSSSYTQSRGEATSNGTSEIINNSNNFVLPPGWYGYAPLATTGKQLVVTFETTFSGYVSMNMINRDLGGGSLFKVFGINTVLNEASVSTRLTTIYSQYLSTQSPASANYQLYLEGAEDPELRQPAFNANERELARQRVELNRS
jgi:hypothetical protein